MSNFFVNLAKSRIKLLLVLITVIVFSIVSVSIAQKISDKNSNTKEDILPKGDWSLSFVPYSKEDNLKIPVFVSAVFCKDKSVKKVELINTSKKSVSAVKFRWLVYTDEERTKVASQGETKLLEFSKGLESGKKANLEYKIVSHKDFFGGFVKENTLNKEFTVEILVSEVQFAENSTWKKDSGIDEDLRWDLIEPAITRNQDCPKQKCKSNPSTVVTGGVYYTCEPSTVNEGCQPANPAYTCNSFSCKKPDSGGEGGEIIVVGEV